MNTSNYFAIIVDDNAYTHFDVIPRKDHTAILDAIEQQLTYEPASQSQNRKPIRIPNTVGATWEIRYGKINRYRVFYDVDIEMRTVLILTVGVKIGNRLFVGGEEIIL